MIRRDVGNNIIKMRLIVIFLLVSYCFGTNLASHPTRNKVFNTLPIQLLETPTALPTISPTRHNSRQPKIDGPTKSPKNKTTKRPSVRPSTTPPANESTTDSSALPTLKTSKPSAAPTTQATSEPSISVPFRHESQKPTSVPYFIPTFAPSEVLPSILPTDSKQQQDSNIDNKSSSRNFELSIDLNVDMQSPVVGIILLLGLLAVGFIGMMLCEIRRLSRNVVHLTTAVLHTQHQYHQQSATLSTSSAPTARSHTSSSHTSHHTISSLLPSLSPRGNTISNIVNRMRWSIGSHKQPMHGSTSYSRVSNDPSADSDHMDNEGLLSDDVL